MSLRLSTLVVASLVPSLLASAALADRVSPAPALRRPAPVQPTAPQPRYAQPPPGPRAPHETQPEPDAPMDRAHLRVVLRAARAKNLAAFQAYMAAGVYPSNTYTAGEKNVWRDRDGHLCAAATIIWRSGAEDLVNRVAEQNNFIRLADVQQGPVMDWILTSGFTQEELVAIQKPFLRVTKQPVLDDSFDAPVDPDLRTAETKRLQKVYKTVAAQLVRDEAKSLDLAADRLMKHPGLAWRALGYGASS